VITLALVLLVAAFVLFVVVALGVTVTRFNLMAAGLACWVLSAIVGYLVR
jgi:hypothetical protein